MSSSLNVGVLGHVDSGKTSLCRMLSTCISTAGLDRNPQSQERGITLDLGFTAFQLNEFQVTLVDCPGHSKLVKTVIGGASIVDMALLVVDLVKGVQAQTMECLVLAEITCASHKNGLIVVLNKSDLVSTERISAVKQEVQVVIEDNTSFKNVPMVITSTNTNTNTALDSMNTLKQAILEMATQNPPNRLKTTDPFLFAIDHCFAIKGKGTILTGTALRGMISVNDKIEIPSLKQTKRIKSMQRFRQNVSSIRQGDRTGICIPGLDEKLLERGLASAPGTLHRTSSVIISVTQVPSFTLGCKSNSRMHITIGHDNVMATVIFFTHGSDKSEFSLDNYYRYEQEMNKDEASWALLKFDKEILCPDNSIAVASRLDLDSSHGIDDNAFCRIAFYGKVVQLESENSLKLYKTRERSGIIDKVLEEKNMIIARGFFQKEATLVAFFGLNVVVNRTGQLGSITSAFGKSGKCRITLDDESSCNVVAGDVLTLRYSILLFRNKNEKTLFQKPWTYPEQQHTSCVDLKELEIVDDDAVKCIEGVVERLKGETLESGRNPLLIVSGLFESAEEVNEYLNQSVVLANGDTGVIEKAFGKGGKVKVFFVNGTSASVGDTVYLQKNVM